MSLTNTGDRYGTLSIAMHWLMFLLLVAVYACICLLYTSPSPRD